MQPLGPEGITGCIGWMELLTMIPAIFLDCGCAALATRSAD